MQIHFAKMGTQEVIKGIHDKLDGRKLGELLEIEADGEGIRVTIRKMGTSTLEFSHQKGANGHTWKLSKEKLAMTHRAFKGEIMDKLTNIIESMGGQVLS